MQYYTPKLSDFFIGYEYEAYNKFFKSWVNEVFNPYLSSQYYEEFSTFKSEIESGQIRVPFLTAEHIVQSGWIIKESSQVDLEFFDSKNVWYTFEKDNYQIRWWGDPDYIEIYEVYTIHINQKEELDCIYQGKCTSINEFRQILNLVIKQK